MTCAHAKADIFYSLYVNENWARGYKTIFKLNSVEHEILNAHKYKNIKKLSFVQTQISRECHFPAHKG